MSRDLSVSAPFSAFVNPPERVWMTLLATATTANPSNVWVAMFAAPFTVVSGIPNSAVSNVQKFVTSSFTFFPAPMTSTPVSPFVTAGSRPRLKIS